MNDLRSRLEAKAVRRAYVPVQVSDPGGDRTRMEEANAAYLRASLGSGVLPEVREEAERALTAAKAAVDTHYVEVWLRALRADDYEALVGAHLSDDGVDWDKALPVALAASAEDESLQDADWWAEQLARDSWTEGDRRQLKTAVLYLNSQAPDPRLPKD